MELQKHTLLKDFPDHHHTIRHLKMNDGHFAKLFDEYHEIESEVHHIEKNHEAVADDYLDSLKNRRVHLKDVLFNYVKRAEQEL
ncbi:YdcH family protein [Paraglaciecola sp. 2405UD69-4]|uniref:YdcH family protein n=1 Tax=Paraglaciecola sp. 2405UD69-4 TaxID=3391836 RepID=UPI0039C9A063